MPDQQPTKKNNRQMRICSRCQQAFIGPVDVYYCEKCAEAVNREANSIAAFYEKRPGRMD